MRGRLETPLFYPKCRQPSSWSSRFDSRPAGLGWLGRSRAVRPRRPQHAGGDLNAVDARDWATAQGIEVKDHGPASDGIKDAGDR